jgi:hypothetical protein
MTACSSPGSDTAFKAPAGWSSTPGLFGRFQMWISGNAQNNRQILMLIRADQNTNIEESNNFGGTRNVNNVHHRQIMICGDQHADYFTGRGESSSGSNHAPVLLEGIVTSVHNARYVAVYIRPAALPPDTQAETAIRSICPQ